MIVDVEGIDARDIQSFELEDKIHDGETIVGSCYKNIGKMSLINENDQYNNLKGQTIKFNDFGNWHVKEIKPNKDTYSTEITLEDESYKLDKPFEKEKFSNIFPCTNGVFAKKILKECNLILGSEEFTNSDFILEILPFIEEKATYRDVIMMIAQSAASFVKINRTNNKVYIRWFDEEITELEDWYELMQDNETKPINIVVLSRGDVEDNIIHPSIIPEKPAEFRIDDNQIIYFKREEAIIPIYNQVNSFRYRVLNARVVGNTKIKSGSKIRYKDDIDGSMRETYIFNHTIKFDGGYESYIENEELKETRTNYQYAGTIEKRVTNTEIIIDKQGKKITAIVEEQDEHSKKLTKQEQNINSIKQSVENTVDFKKTVNGTNQIKLKEAKEGDMLVLGVSGIKEYNNYLYPGENLFPSQDLYPNMEVV